MKDLSLVKVDRLGKTLQWKLDREMEDKIYLYLKDYLLYKFLTSNFYNTTGLGTSIIQTIGKNNEM